MDQDEIEEPHAAAASMFNASGFRWLVKFVAVQLPPAAWRHAFPISEGSIERTRILIAQEARDFVNFGRRVGQKLPPEFLARFDQKIAEACALFGDAALKGALAQA